MSFWIPCSAPPKARAKATFAKLCAYSAEIRVSLALATESCACMTSMLSVTPAAKAVARLGQRLIGKVEIVLRHRHLIGGRANIEERRADLIIDLARDRKFVLALLQEPPWPGSLRR